MIRRVIVAIAVAGLAMGCANVPPAQIGQTAGMIAGSAIGPAGAPLGALVGTLAGMVFQGQMDKATERRERQELGGQLRRTPTASADRTPTVPTGTPVRVWVDETVQDGRLVAGHFDVRYLP